MPEAEVGFSAPERPVVESRYNQLKGPWSVVRNAGGGRRKGVGGKWEPEWKGGEVGRWGGGKVERGGGILVVGLQPRGSPGPELDSRVNKNNNINKKITPLMLDMIPDRN